MTTSSINGPLGFALALLLGASLIGPPSRAQEPAPIAGQAPKALDGRGGWPGRQHAAEAMRKWRERRFRDLHAILHIRPDQEAAFSTFQGAMEPSQREGEPPRGKAMDWSAASTPDVLAHQVERAEARLAHMRKRLEAVKSFYAALSAEQKQAFDAVHRLREGPRRPGMGGRGWGGMGGGGMGGRDRGPPWGPGAPPHPGPGAP